MHTSIGICHLYMSVICASGMRCVCISMCTVCARQACVCSYTAYASGMCCVYVSVISASGMRLLLHSVCVRHALRVHERHISVRNACICASGMRCLNMHVHTDVGVAIYIVVRVSYV